MKTRAICPIRSSEPDREVSVFGKLYSGLAAVRWLRIAGVAVFTFCLSCLGSRASAQLAITEVMSDAATTNLLGEVFAQGQDYWELTNFGTEPIDLSEYRFRDSGPFSLGLEPLFAGVSIAPNESIVCVRRIGDLSTDEATRQLFLDWWGRDQLPEHLQVVTYDSNIGFSSTGEVCQLWRIEDGEGVTVDSVKFPAATRGYSFTYYPETGLFGVLSDLESGAVRAPRSGDIGSPGRTTGPVPLRLLAEPESLSVCAGSPATIRVRFQGLPRPQVRWFRNGSWLTQKMQEQLLFDAVDVSDAGDYMAEIGNGFQTLRSRVATLSVSTIPSPPIIEAALTDMSVTLFQPATFRVGVCAYPPAVFQWSFEGKLIIGATNREYTVEGADAASVGVYSVRISNSHGITNVSARLRVDRQPDLRITEVMAAPSTNTTVLGHRDWWELTNFETNAVSIRGYRWDDGPVPGLEGAPLADGDIVLQAGESIVFVKGMTRDAFVSWWGRDNLPEGLQVITYFANGLNALSETITVWNATAVDPDDVVDSIGYVNCPTGISLWFDTRVRDYESGVVSIPGQRGAFVASESDDVGSPGWTENHLKLNIRREGQGLTLSWAAQTGENFQVYYTEDPINGAWKVLKRVTASSATANVRNIAVDGPTPRFYKVTKP